MNMERQKERDGAGGSGTGNDDRVLLVPGCSSCHA